MQLLEQRTALSLCVWIRSSQVRRSLLLLRIHCNKGGIAMEIVKEALVHSQKPLMQTLESMNAALADKKADERCPTFGSIDVDPDAMVVSMVVLFS